MPQPSRILIYGLLNPATAELFYIGQTRKRREFRLLEHIDDAVGGSPLPVHKYIRDLMGSGRIPKIFVIERVADVKRADEMEIRWIRHFCLLSESSLPLTISPQTPKSNETTILSVDIQNVKDVPYHTCSEQEHGERRLTRPESNDEP